MQTISTKKTSSTNRTRKKYVVEFDRERAEECLSIWRNDKALIKLIFKWPSVKANWREPIVNITTGEIYNNARQTEEITGINHQVISKVCRHIPSYETAGGYEWEYLSTIEDYANHKQNPKEEQIRR